MSRTIQDVLIEQNTKLYEHQISLIQHLIQIERGMLGDDEERMSNLEFMLRELWDSRDSLKDLRPRFLQ